jgi:hypothetical protein
MNFNKEKYDEILAKGLMDGLGDESNTCIEGAVSLALGEPLNAFPKCVATELARIGIQINDYAWESNAVRADAMYKFGLAQLGTRNPRWHTTTDVMTNFTKKFKYYIITKYVVDVVQRVFSDKEDILKLVDDLATDEPGDWFNNLALVVREDYSLGGATRLDFKGMCRTFADGTYLNFLDYTQKLIQNRLPDSTLSKEYYPRMLLQLAIDTLKEVGHSNEFDSIWKA